MNKCHWSTSASIFGLYDYLTNEKTVWKSHGSTLNGTNTEELKGNGEKTVMLTFVWAKVFFFRFLKSKAFGRPSSVRQRWFIDALIACQSDNQSCVLRQPNPPRRRKNPWIHCKKSVWFRSMKCYTPPLLTHWRPSALASPSDLHAAPCAKPNCLWSDEQAKERDKTTSVSHFCKAKRSDMQWMTDRCKRGCGCQPIFSR